MDQEKVLKTIDQLCSQQQQYPQYVSFNSILMNDVGFAYLLIKVNTQLINLHLNNNQLTSLSVLRMKDKNIWDSLEELDLGLNFIAAKGCKYLSRINFNQIRLVSLIQNSICSEGVSHLAKSTWRTLKQLWLHQNKIGNQGIKNMSRALWIRSINIIYVWQNELQADEVYNFILCDIPDISQMNFRNNKTASMCIYKLRKAMKEKYIQVQDINV